MARTLAIFDVGGVMVDGHDVRPRMAELLGIELAELLPLLVTAGSDELAVGRMTAEEFWRRMLDLTGRSVSEDLWGLTFAPTRRPALYGLVERLQAAGVRVVAGTNTMDSHYRIHLDAGDYDVFEKVYASQLLGVAKPDVRFWQMILESEGVPAEGAVFVDDMPENVAAAASVGLTTVQCVDVRQTVSAVEELFGLAPTDS